MTHKDEYIDVEKLIENRDIPQLCSILYNDDFSIRKEASMALKKFADPSTEEILIENLKYEEWESEYEILSAVRANCAEALGHIGNESSVNALIGALDDPDFEVNIKSAEALGKIGNPIAIDMLVYSLNSRYAEVRIAAVRALGNIGDESAINHIIELLNKDPIWNVRVNAIIALTQFDDTRILDALINAMCDEDIDVQKHAINGLIKLDDYALNPLLKKLTHNKWEIRAVSAETLGKIGNPLAEPYLKKLLVQPTADENYYVRSKVAEALGEIGEETSIPILKEALNDDYFVVRNRAAEALELIEMMDELCHYETTKLRFDFPCKLKIKEIYAEGKLLIAYLPESNLKISFNYIKDSEDIDVPDFIDVMEEIFEKRGLENIYKKEDKISNKRAILIQGCDFGDEKMVKVIAFKHDDALHYIRISLNMTLDDNLKKYLRVMQNSFMII